MELVRKPVTTPPADPDLWFSSLCAPCTAPATHQAQTATKQKRTVSAAIAKHVEKREKQKRRGVERVHRSSKEAAALGMVWTIKQNARSSIPATHPMCKLEKLRELWDSYISHHRLSPVLLNSQDGKLKRCHLSISPSIVTEGEGETWDKARLRALWRALQRLDADLSAAWRRLHPGEAAKLDI